MKSVPASLAATIIAFALATTFAPAAYATHTTIGYIGCSNSGMTVEGYNFGSVPDQKLFWLGYPNSSYNTNGGVINYWANPTVLPGSHFWAEFDQMVAKNGQPTSVWVQICEESSLPATYTDVVNALSVLRAHTTPSTVFYISPLNTYNPATLCTSANWQHTITLANQAVGNGLGLAGPGVASGYPLGPLTASQVNTDGCHPNTAGRVFLGEQLAAFFG